MSYSVIVSWKLSHGKPSTFELQIVKRLRNLKIGPYHLKVTEIHDNWKED